MTGFNVDPAELRTFAKHQFDRQKALESAADTAAAVNLGGETFGQLLQWFGNKAEAKAQETVQAIRELAKAVGNAAEDTISTAETYEAYEDSNRNRFGGDR